jgi:ComEC/Rec2-related protein
LVGPIFVIAVIAATFFMLFGGKKSKAYALLSFIFAVGCFYPHFYARVIDIHPVIADGNVEGKITSYPVSVGNSISFSVKSSVAGRVNVIAEKFSDIGYGDTVAMTCSYDRDKLFCRDGSVLIKGCRGLMCRAFGVREAISDALRRELSSSSSALAAGILFGDRSGFTSGFSEKLKASGTSHIVALSGFNITVVVSFFGGLLFLLPHKWRWMGLIAAVMMFVAVVGPSASVVRAAIMGSLSLIGKRSGKILDIKGPISLSAGMMVLWDPSIIVSDAGFILSFCALFGIVFIAPKIKKILFRDKKPNAVGAIIIECVSAEVAATPAILIFFGAGSWFSFIPNAMIIWTVPFAMFASFVCGAISATFGSFIALPFSVMAETALKYETWIIDIFSFGG